MDIDFCYYAFHASGPANLVLGLLVIGAILVCTMQGLGEMTILYPVNGGKHCIVLGLSLFMTACLLAQNLAVNRPV